MYVTSLGQEESGRLTDIISGVAADYNRMVGSLSGDPTDFTPYIHQADHGKRKPKQKTMKAQSPAGGECIRMLLCMYEKNILFVCMYVSMNVCMCVCIYVYVCIVSSCSVMICMYVKFYYVLICTCMCVRSSYLLLKCMYV